jgi:hypothetical protein
LAGQLYQPGNNKKHGWLSAGTTYHLFKAKPENHNASIRVEITDRFGNIYSQEIIHN